MCRDGVGVSPEVGRKWGAEVPGDSGFSGPLRPGSPRWRGRGAGAGQGQGRGGGTRPLRCVRAALSAPRLATSYTVAGLWASDPALPHARPSRLRLDGWPR